MMSLLSLNAKLKVWALSLLIILLVSGCTEETNPDRLNISSNIRVGELLDLDDENGFSRADGDKQFKFPDDHGDHPDFKQERWQFSGNVGTGSGRRIGYQLAIHRVGLEPEKPTEANRKRLIRSNSTSAWRSKNLYLATLSITDMNSRRFFQTEKVSRNAVGLSRVEVFKSGSGKKNSKKSDTHRTANFFFNIDDWSVKSTGVKYSLSPSMLHSMISTLI